MAILTPAERIGTTVAGKYRLDRVLGAGGMGTVFAGVHAWTGRDVAVKMLNPDYANDAQVVQRFLQEARAAARLRHPNVVDVLDMGQGEDGAVYLVLELMHGGPLKDRVARGPMPVDETLAHLLPVIDALAAAHARGIVHRDLKPDNIYLALDERGIIVPKLLDFGIAKVAGGNTAKTGTGFIVGTPQYMSPEQALGKGDLGPPSDVWSMGVVLFECLTGKLPFEAESPTGMLVAIVTQRAPSVGTLGVDLPAELAAVIDRTLMTDPLARYAHAGELSAALHAAIGSAGLSVSVARALPPSSQASSAGQPLTPGTPQLAVEPQPAGDAPPATPSGATPFTWASEDAASVSGLRKPRTGLWLALGGVGALLSAAVIGAGVMLGAGDDAAQGAPGTAATTSAATTTAPSEPPVESVLAAPPVAPPTVVAPVVPPVVAAPPVAVRATTLEPDAGRPRAPAGARAERSSGSHAKAPPAVAAPPVPARPTRPRPPVVPRPPSTERGANNSLILD